MKKLIAISVMCALVAGAAFADTSIGGQVFVAGALAKGDNVNGSTVESDGVSNDQYNTSLKINFSDGNAGGRIRILGTNAGASDIFDEWFGWWRPTDFLRIKVGKDQDGEYGTANISGWGFTGENKNNGGNQGAMAEYGSSAYANMLNEGRNHSRTIGWYGGNGGKAAINFNVYPFEWLAVNLWFPWDGDNALVSLAKVNLNLNITAGDFGKLNVSYEGDTGYLAPLEELKKEDKDAKTPWYGDAGVTAAANSPKVYLSFYSSDFFTLVDGFGFDIGLAYKFPFTHGEILEDEEADIDAKAETVTYHPFEIGLGLRYGVGDFNIKLRSSVTLGASTVAGDEEPVKEPTKISLNILPSYKVGNITIFLYGGIGIQAVEADVWKADKGTDTIVSWFVNPYVLIPTSGGLRFKVGLQIYSDGEPEGSYYNNYDPDTKAGKQFNKPIIRWAIPFGFYTYL